MRHFHFTTWPDFGVPEPPSTLVKFVRAFRERCTPDNNKPIIVHCSAGVGRSGTFIALDRLLQHIIKYDTVDIFGIVHEMRKERVWMVQNEVRATFLGKGKTLLTKLFFYSLATIHLHSRLST